MVYVILKESSIEARWRGVILSGLLGPYYQAERVL